MIDPLGPDPNDPAVPSRQVGEIVPKADLPEPPGLSRPRVRYANYDRPEALIRPVAASPAAAELPPALKPAAVPAPDPVPIRTPATDPVPLPPAPAPSIPSQTALARPTPPLNKPTKLERAIGLARTVLPLVGKMLPLLEGNVVSAATNLLAPRPVEVNLKPLEEAISHLQADQRALSFHTSEQKRALRRLEDEFATLQEAVQKNAEQQAELTEHVAKLAKRTASFNRLILILLVASILFTGLLCVRIAYIIRF